MPAGAGPAVAPRHTGKIAFARELVEAVAARHPDRRVHAVGMPSGCRRDAADVGEQLRGLWPQVTWTWWLKVTSVLHEPARPAPADPGDPAPKAPGWAPSRPGRSRDVAHHQGPPLRPHRHHCTSPR